MPQKPVFACRAAPRTARSDGGSRHPKGSQFSCLLTSCKPSVKKVRPRARPPAPAYGVRCSPRPRDAKHRETALRNSAVPFPKKQPPHRGGRAGRLPLGRNAQRLLLPASTPNDPSRATDPVPLGTRKLGFARQNPLVATRLSKNNHWPRASEIFSNAYPAFERFRHLGAARGGLRGLPCAGGGPYAGRAVPPGTRYYPFGRENSLCPRAWGNHTR